MIIDFTLTGMERKLCDTKGQEKCVVKTWGYNWDSNMIVPSAELAMEWTYFSPTENVFLLRGIGDAKIDDVGNTGGGLSSNTDNVIVDGAIIFSCPMTGEPKEVLSNDNVYCIGQPVAE